MVVLSKANDPNDREENNDLERLCTGYLINTILCTGKEQYRLFVSSSPILFEVLSDSSPG
jgi:hypothetical protein